MTSHPAFLAYYRGSHTRILSVKCEIFHPLSLGKWISEQAAKYPSPITVAAVDYSLSADGFGLEL